MVFYRLENFNKGCSSCTLSSGCAVSGQSEVPFSKVLLIIISAYPGAAELEQDISLAPSNKVKPNMGAGEFLRRCISAKFDKDEEELIPKPFIERIYLTNAIKCSPQKGRDKINITNQHLKTCKEQWLLPEINQFHPETPILLAASEAVKSMLGFQESISNNREKIIYINSHPTVCTFNPIEWERGSIKELKHKEGTIKDLKKLYESTSKPTKHQINKVIESYYWFPALAGTPLYFVNRDLDKIKKLVIEFLPKTLPKTLKENSSL